MPPSFTVAVVMPPSDSVGGSGPSALALSAIVVVAVFEFATPSLTTQVMVRAVPRFSTPGWVKL